MLLYLVGDKLNQAILIDTNGTYIVCTVYLLPSVLVPTMDILSLVDT